MSNGTRPLTDKERRVMSELFAEEPQEDQALDTSPPRNLPSKFEDLQLHSKRERSLIDYAQDVFPKVYGNPYFRRLCASTNNRNAAEGSLAADITLTGVEIRKAAPEGSPLTKATAWECGVAVNRVLDRYGIGRAQS